jgi:hypothetical protein
LVFRDFDSPPLAIAGVSGEGYSRLLVFKQQSGRKLYLFWGNPLAKIPQYDLSELVAKQKLEEIPVAYLSQVHPNAKFIGSKARMPFTERYKYLLCFVFLFVIAVLLFFQYRVFKRMKS